MRLPSVPEEVALRALALILKAVGGADYTPRLDCRRGALRRDPRAPRGRDGEADALRRRRVGRRAAASAARREWGGTGLPMRPRRRARRSSGTGGSRSRCRALNGRAQRRRAGAVGAPLPRRDGRGAAAVQALPGLYRNGTLVAVPPAVLAGRSGRSASSACGRVRGRTAARNPAAERRACRVEHHFGRFRLQDGSRAVLLGINDARTYLGV